MVRLTRTRRLRDARAPHGRRARRKELAQDLRIGPHPLVPPKAFLERAVARLVVGELGLERERAVGRRRLGLVVAHQRNGFYPVRRFRSFVATTRSSSP